ncbi:Fructosamine kinase-domain-containing protein [Dendryphion nanum]|uniref:protein-ribulosamine 3-kinase n=1 Tax=Dendryphion nanum TaxID=256645 RepID=A0A9P9IPL3_9PLEO|nr:Fructosamine kinase-domain-containing protein [Dendryphion nanum]
MTAGNIQCQQNKSPEHQVPKDVVSYIDEAVSFIISSIGQDLIITGISPHGVSRWTRTARVKVKNALGNRISYFLKVSRGQIGKSMMEGEYHSMLALYHAMPALSPEPIGWGKYLNMEDTYFFLSSFTEMTGDIPASTSEFPAMVAKLHHENKSPNGKFGFLVPTYHGNLPQDVSQCDIWEESFTSGMVKFFDLEEEAQGRDQTMTILRKDIILTVIPRLLRPLESEGRRVTPSLVHGDLWDGNVSVDATTGAPVIFDACCSYAHNEYDLAPWWANRHNIGKAHIEEYLRHFPVSEPAGDFEDRMTLYCIRFNLCSSALNPGNKWFRDLLKEDMRFLAAKFPRGVECTPSSVPT